ncbi:MAG: SulP family inorganic anion transporter [Alphaproteobacteria bacterium]|nr:SulP family inorganic anion transporter [Alphaproteobacteria bacterium]
MVLIDKKPSNYFHGFVPKFFRTLRNEKYSKTKLKSDIIAGLTVAIVALPLSMALAIASGTTPDRGLFTAIVAGFIISFLGGSRFQVGGPTGAFVVVIYNIINKYGYDGLAVATILAGLILILAGFFKLGSMIKYIPYPVVTGFTAGIAVIIFSSQIKDLFGLNMNSVPADFVDKWIAYFRALPTTDKATLLVSLITLGLMLVIRKYKPRWPFFLIGVIAGSIFVILMHLPVDTIGTKFGGIPSSIPMPSLPKFGSFDQVMELFPSAFTIAFLAGIESLLSAVVADSIINL